MKYLKLQNSTKLAIVEDAHYEYLSKFKWTESSSGTIQQSFRSKITGRTRNIALASAVMSKPFEQFDHIDRNPLNNLKSNLRLCNRSQNEANKAKQAGLTSKYKGVFWDKQRQKWNVQVAKDKTKYSLGRYTDEIAAAKAYDVKAKQLFGCFAVLNFPALA